MADKHALVIDDNALNVDVMVTLLEQMAIVAYTLDSPQFIAETIERMPQVDLVFLDIEFPDSNGFDVIKQLKQFLSLIHI